MKVPKGLLGNGCKLVSGKHNTFLGWWIPMKSRNITLPETNIAPENRPSQKETSIETIHFQVLC